MTDTQPRPLTDLAELAIALGGSIDSFTGDLLRLIAKADVQNTNRLAIAFPRHVFAWALWMVRAPAMTDVDLEQLLPIDPYADLTIDQLIEMRMTLLSTAQELHP